MTLSQRQAEFTRLMTRLKAWAYQQPLIASGAMYFKTTWVKRSLEKQKALVAAGTSKTLGSSHLEELAEDLQLYWRGGEPIWSRKHYVWLGEEAERIGLKWGGRWKSISDPYHFQYAGQRRKK